MNATGWNVKRGFSPILIILILVMDVNAHSKERPTKDEPKFRTKVGLDIAGVPYGIPGFHVEIGHANLAAITGVGLSISTLYAVTKPDPRFCLFVGAVLTPVPSSWPLIPRVLVLYTNDAAYLHYRAKSENNEWRTFYKEQFSGYCVLLEFEFRLEKLGFAAFENKPNWSFELGAGINKPSVSWATIIDERARLAERLVESDPFYYWWLEPIQTSIHVAFHIGFAYYL